MQIFNVWGPNVVGHSKTQGAPLISSTHMEIVVGHLKNTGGDDPLLFVGHPIFSSKG